MSDEVDQQFDAIIRDNDMGDWQPISLDELAIILSSITSAASHITNFLLEGFDATDPENLVIPIDIVRLLRMVYRCSEDAQDQIVEHLYTNAVDEFEDEEDEEDDQEDI